MKSIPDCFDEGSVYTATTLKCYLGSSLYRDSLKTLLVGVVSARRSLALSKVVKCGKTGLGRTTWTRELLVICTTLTS